jgi:hypothetical protein
MPLLAFGEPAVNPRYGRIYTDRSLYRPGHSVDFKAIFRREQGQGYSVPDCRIDFQVQDPDVHTIFARKTVDGFRVWRRGPATLAAPG